MNKQVKRWERFSLESLVQGQSDDRGRLFLSELGQENLEGVRVLHQGLDTVKQLYAGVLRPVVLEEVAERFQAGFGECIELGGHVWAVGSGGASGYQYRLQNSDLGLICFLKSRYAEAADEGSHLKVEASPHWIHPRSVEQMHGDLQALAAVFLESARPSGVSVHLCVDVQGWEPPRDFSDTLVTRARRSSEFDGGNVLYMNLGESASVFNRRETYMYGSASTVQFCMYRKDVQVRKADKQDFWEHVWSQAAGESFEERAYDSAAPVWRLEFRFHQSVLADFGRGMAQDMDYGFSFQSAVWAGLRGVCGHLQGLWAYALNSFRSERRVSARGARYYAPLWQFLLDDVRWSSPEGDFTYRRVKKTPGVGNEKNLMLALGNLLSVYARNGFSVSRAWQCIKASGIYDDLYNYFERRAYFRMQRFQESDIYQFVQRALNLRVLQGRAA